MIRKKPTLSFTKSGEIYIPTCNDHSVLFPSDVNPEQWPSCNDAYEYTWNLDMGNDITALSKIDRLKLSKSSGFCPQNRCQLTNLTSTKNDGKCPENLCYTKLENGGRSYGACCFIDGAFNSGNLIGYYNKTQATPKPIYKKSRIILDSIDSKDDNNQDAYSRYINANQIYPGIIATQCPLENTINDIHRMIIEQNISLWIQLAPLALTDSNDSDPTSQCQYNPNTFIDSSYNYTNTTIKPILNTDNNIKNPINFTGNSFLNNNYIIKYEYTDTTIREQHINHIWYKNWRDFDIPDKNDSEVSSSLYIYIYLLLQYAFILYIFSVYTVYIIVYVQYYTIFYVYVTDIYVYICICYAISSPRIC